MGVSGGSSFTFCLWSEGGRAGQYESLEWLMVCVDLDKVGDGRVHARQVIGIDESKSALLEYTHTHDRWQGIEARAQCIPCDGVTYCTNNRASDSYYACKKVSRHTLSGDITCLNVPWLLGR